MRAHSVSPFLRWLVLFSVSGWGMLGKWVKRFVKHSKPTVWSCVVGKLPLHQHALSLRFPSNIDTSLKGKHSYTVFTIGLGRVDLESFVAVTLLPAGGKTSFCFHAHSPKRLWVDMQVMAALHYRRWLQSAALCWAEGSSWRLFQTTARPWDPSPHSFVILCQWCTVLMLALLWLHYMTHKTVLYLTWD